MMPTESDLFMSIAGRLAANEKILARAAGEYVDRLGLPNDGAYCTRADLAQAFLAGCEYVQVREYEREIIAATYADGVIEVRFGDEHTIELTPKQLGLPPDLIAEVDFHPLWLNVRFLRPHQLHANHSTPQTALSYSVSSLRMRARDTDTTAPK